MGAFVRCNVKNMKFEDFPETRDVAIGSKKSEVLYFFIENS